jgi:hypothetical protein
VLEVEVDSIEIIHKTGIVAVGSIIVSAKLKIGILADAVPPSPEDIAAAHAHLQISLRSRPADNRDGRCQLSDVAAIHVSLNGYRVPFGRVPVGPKAEMTQLPIIRARSSRGEGLIASKYLPNTR